MSLSKEEFAEKAKADCKLTDDGYYAFWASFGFITANQLRMIAAHLDQVNAERDKKVKEVK